MTTFDAPAPTSPCKTWPKHAVVREVGLRDGLQSIAQTLATDKKKEWIAEDHAAGQPEIEVGSFVPARLMPQLAEPAELVDFSHHYPRLTASVLVANLKGAEPAIPAGAHYKIVPLSANHNQE